MAGSPEWKIYRDGEYVAACKYAEDAAALVGVSGGVVKHGHKLVVWTEGSEEFLAADSWDAAAAVMEKRRFDASAEAYRKLQERIAQATR